MYIYAVETAIQMTLTELNENLREIYIEAYTQKEASDYIFRETAKELQQIFGPYLPGRTARDFYDMEIGSASIMRGYMAHPCDAELTLEKKLRLFFCMSLRAYRVPEDELEQVIRFVEGLDIRTIAERVMHALFVALAMATSFISFPILPNPAFSFLKYDPSGIVCLIAGFAYGPAAAAIVSVLVFVPHVFMDPWGTLMAVLVALTLSVPAALIYRHVHTRKGAVIGLVVGALLALVAAIAGNLVITPIYTGWPVSEVAAIIVPALLPFNLIKFVIHGVVTFLVYKPISNLLNR